MMVDQAIVLSSNNKHRMIQMLDDQGKQWNQATSNTHTMTRYMIQYKITHNNDKFWPEYNKTDTETNNLENFFDFNK